MSASKSRRVVGWLLVFGVFFVASLRSDIAGATPSPEFQAKAKPKADPTQPGQIGAPIPGVVSTVAVELNQKLKKGDRLLVMEAMKMQSTVYSPVAGTVTQVLVAPGQQVEAKDLLLVVA